MKIYKGGMLVADIKARLYVLLIRKKIFVHVETFIACAKLNAQCFIARLMQHFMLSMLINLFLIKRMSQHS